MIRGVRLRKRTAALFAAATLVIAGVAAPALAEDGPAPGTDLPAAAVITFTAPNDGEAWKARFTDQESIKLAYDDLAGKLDVHVFPIGKIVWDDPEVNTGYTWHITGASLTEIAAEACDGRPSYVVKGQWAYPYFCPWQAEIVHIEPAA
jgi:hypothetical protein